MAEILLDNVEQRYGDHVVLHKVNLTIRDGEFISLLGPSGCGKSTILRLIAGLDFPSGGRICLDGTDITKLNADERNIAMVFQSYALYPHMTVAENIAVPLEQRWLSRAQRLPLLRSLIPGTRQIQQKIKQAVADSATATSLTHLLQRQPSQLSGGQKQRVALARAMVRHPKAFLLDEPLSNLDAHLRTQVREEIAQMHKRLGTTFLYVTHDQEEAMALSDRVAVMKEGVILQVDSPRELYSNPRTLDVAKFVGQPQINTLESSVDCEGRLVVEGVPQSIWLEDHKHTKCTIAVRPNQLTVSMNARETAIRVDVDQKFYLGGAELWLLVLPSGRRLTATFVEGGIPLNEADYLYLSLPPAEILIFDSAGKRISIPKESVTPLRKTQWM